MTKRALFPLVAAGCGLLLVMILLHLGKERLMGTGNQRSADTVPTVSARAGGAQEPGDGLSGEPRRTGQSAPVLVQAAGEESVLTTIPLVVKGTVRLVDGSALSSASVRLARGGADVMAPWESETVVAMATGGAGEYRLAIPVEKNLRLIVEHPGLASQVVEVTDGDSVAAQVVRGIKSVGLKRDFVLSRAAPLVGRVTDAKGTALTGAVIKTLPVQEYRFTDLWVRVTTSTADGLFRVDGLPPGRFAMGVSHAAMQSWNGIIQLPNESVTVTLLDGGGTVEGEVVSFETGLPLRDVHVSLQPKRLESQDYATAAYPRVRTGADGRFRLEHVSSDEHRLSVVSGELTPFPGEQRALADFELGENETTSGLRIRMSSGFTVRGVVRDEDTSQPLADVAYSPEYSKTGPEDPLASTDRSGKYEIRGIRLLNIAGLKFRRSGYHLLDEHGQPAEFLKMVLGKETTTTLSRDVRMMRSPVVAGRVVDEFGAGIPGATVIVLSRRERGAHPRFRAETDGSFTLPIRPGEKLSLKAEASGYGPGYLLEQVGGPSVSGELRLVLLHGASVEGLVVDSTGKLVSGIVVAAHYVPTGRPGQGEYSPFVDAVGSSEVGVDGVFRFSALPAGPIRLQAAELGGLVRRTEWVSLRAGEERRDVRIVLPDQKAITGKLISAENSTPIAAGSIGAYTEYGGGAGGSGRSDEEGNFRIENLDASSSYTVTGEHESYEDKQVGGVFPDGDPVELRLTPRRTVTLTVNLLDSVTNAPVADGVLSVHDVEGREIPVERMEHLGPGKFRVTDLKAGDMIQMEMKAPGYVELERQSSIPKGQVEAEVTIYLRRGVAVSGRLVSRGDGKPLPGLGVMIGNRRYERPEAEPVASDAEGKFRINSVAPGPCQLAVASSVSDEGQILLFRPIDVPAGQDLDLGTVEIGKGGVISGRVLQRPHDRPVAGEPVELEVQGKHHTVTTDEQGVFRFEEIAYLGWQAFEVRLPRRDVGQRSAVSLKDGETREIVFRVGGATLKGRTMRYGQGEASRVMLMLGDSDHGQVRSCQSDGTGAFEVSDLAPGRWQIRASTVADGAAVTEFVEIPESGTVELDLHFRHVSISGRVVSAEGTPVASASVELREKGLADSFSSQPNLMSRTEVSRSDGTFLFNAVSPGAYMLLAHNKAGGRAATDLEIVPDTNVEGLELKLTSGEATVISLALDAQSGEPVESAACAVYLPDGTPVNEGQGRRGPDGIMRLENLPAGEMVVWVGGGDLTEVLHQVELAPGETKSFTDLLEFGGSFRWILQKGDGSAVPDLPVRLAPLDPESRERVRESRTSSSGAWDVSGLHPGRYSATVTLPDEKSRSETVTVVPSLPAVVVTVVD